MLFIAESLFGKFDEFSAFWRHQQAIICLEISADLAERCAFIRRVEIKQRAEPGMLDGRDE